MLFPPLMGIEVVGTRVRSATLVVNAKVSLNLVAQTLEQASGQRAAASPLRAGGAWRVCAALPCAARPSRARALPPLSGPVCVRR